MVKPGTLVIGIGVALACLGGYNVVHTPQQEQVRLTHAKVAEEQANQQTQTEVAQLLTQVEQYRARLPQAPEAGLLVRDVVELARASGVQLTNIAPGSPQTLPHFTLLSVNLQGSGSYHQVGAFLDAIERSSRFMRVNQLTVNSGGDAQPASIQLTVYTLYVPRPAVPSSSGGEG